MKETSNNWLAFAHDDEKMAELALREGIYPSWQKTTAMAVDECQRLWDY